MPHHSSEELNLSVGIRASFTQRLFQFLFFDWILVLLGYSPEMVYAVAAVHLLLAYWHHTQIIKKLGWFEKYFVTPLTSSCASWSKPTISGQKLQRVPHHLGQDVWHF